MNKVNVDASVLLSFAIRPDQVESINSWISGICKDYSGIIPLGAKHPEHPDPEAESMYAAAWDKTSWPQPCHLGLQVQGIHGVRGRVVRYV